MKFRSVPDQNVEHDLNELNFAWMLGSKDSLASFGAKARLKILSVC
jgi:hypothetical protein